MSAILAPLLYLLAGVLLIVFVRKLSTPDDGNDDISARVGFAGMSLAIVVTLFSGDQAWSGLVWLPGVLLLVTASSVGVWLEQALGRSDSPRLMAIVHLVCALAALLIFMALHLRPGVFDVAGRPGAFTGLALGLAFSMAVLAGAGVIYAKLAGYIADAPQLAGRHGPVNLGLGVVTVFCALWYGQWPSSMLFGLVAVGGLATGARVIVPLGQDQRSVAAALIGSAAGWAAAGMGFALGNLVLILVGGLAGAAALSLSRTMCAQAGGSLRRALRGWPG